MTTDKNIRYQQNLDDRRIAIVALGNGRWTVISLYVAQIVSAVDEVTRGSFVEIEMPEPGT